MLSLQLCGFVYTVTSVPGKHPFTAFHGATVAAMFKHPWALTWDTTVMYYVLAFDRFVEHRVAVEKEPGMIEWQARKSIQEKEAQEQDAAAKQTASVAEHMPKEENFKDKDIRLMEMGGEEASGPETNLKTRKHKYTHHLR